MVMVMESAHHTQLLPCCAVLCAVDSSPVDSQRSAVSQSVGEEAIDRVGEW